MKYLFSLFLFFLLFGCESTAINQRESGTNILEANEVSTPPDNILSRSTVYIPIYSDIYTESKAIKFELTATLSIRNTSLKDSIFIFDIDYYDTNGQLVRQYLENSLVLSPMQSIEYVIEEEDSAGGTGANFIVRWGARQSDLNPIFQGVMISTRGQQGISFLTEGIKVKE